MAVTLRAGNGGTGNARCIGSNRIGLTKVLCRRVDAKSGRNLATVRLKPMSCITKWGFDSPHLHSN
jgi:hypothetical protein